MQGTATESPAAQQEVDTVRESNAKERTFTVEAPKGALKQATLSSFLLKADKPQVKAACFGNGFSFHLVIHSEVLEIIALLCSYALRFRVKVGHNCGWRWQRGL